MQDIVIGGVTVLRVVRPGEFERARLEKEEARISELESQGLTRSDAQGLYMLEQDAEREERSQASARAAKASEERRAWERDITQENLKPGDLLKNSWGATMRHTDFWQVIDVKGSRVRLGKPECRAEGNQEGHQWIEARAEAPEYVRNAKLLRGRLKLCCRLGSTGYNEKTGAWDKDQSWDLEDSHWYVLSRAKPGEKEAFYGD